jgi:hypothetical protein
MQTDYIGNEISWKLNDRDQQIAGGSDYPNNSLIEVTRCVDGGIHTFSITDTVGDGICCQYGPGWYQIWYDGVIIHDSDGKYGSEEIISFTESGIVESRAPTSVVVLEESSQEGLENNPKFGISGWIYVSLAVLSVVRIICLVRRTISFKLRAEEEAAQGNESSPIYATTKPQKMGSDLAGSDQSKLNGRSYLQSWVLWAENSADNSERDTTQNSERDNQTVDETIFEDVSSALFEDVPSAL